MSISNFRHLTAHEYEVLALTADPALRDMVTALPQTSDRHITSPEARAAIAEVAARRGIAATTTDVLVDAYMAIRADMGLPIRLDFGDADPRD